jgi:hypothetical protein
MAHEQVFSKNDFPDTKEDNVSDVGWVKSAKLAGMSISDDDEFPSPSKIHQLT